jgi:hypothetical protein
MFSDAAGGADKKQNPSDRAKLRAVATGFFISWFLA